MTIRKTIVKSVRITAVSIFLVVWTTLASAPGQAAGLKIALLPIVDSLPFYVAAAQGYFKEAGMPITALPVDSALERDQLMQAGAVDGALNEMIAVANVNRETVQVKVIGVARKARPGVPLFRLLAAPGSGLSRPTHLAGVPIGVSAHTTSEYVTDRVLVALGLPPQRIEKKSVPSIPERYQRLLQGQIRAATLPDPLALSAIRAGAIEVVNDSSFSRYSFSVLSFTDRALGEKADAVRIFLAGWYRAAADINADSEAFRPLVMKHIRVPGNIGNTFRVPPFPKAGVPDAGQWADVMDWMTARGLIDKPVSYEGSVTDAYLPR
ncbi:MAG: ABC transporter substrate-binding protein [Desulfobacterales bacterium]|nr:ABC transporter substrate-binding protein [Desulfobacterales bacterium]